MGEILARTAKYRFPVLNLLVPVFFFMYSRATWIRNFYFISCIQVPGHMFLKFKILFLTLLVFTGTGTGTYVIWFN